MKNEVVCSFGSFMEIIIVSYFTVLFPRTRKNDLGIQSTGLRRSWNILKDFFTLHSLHKTHLTPTYSDLKVMLYLLTAVWEKQENIRSQDKNSKSTLNRLCHEMHNKPDAFIKSDVCLCSNCGSSRRFCHY